MKLPLMIGLHGVAALLLATLFATSSVAVDNRRFVFEYETLVGPIAEGDGPVHIFVSLAANSSQQRILDEEIVASIEGRIETDGKYGNRYWHGWIEQSEGQSIDVRVRTLVERRISRMGSNDSSRRLSESERQEFADFLGPNVRVVVDHPILEPIRAEIRLRAGSDDPARISRAIYDWVVENVEYKKVGTGWGNGDTFWACNERYGNCTDFHALFISLARAEGIPARFEIGFPVPDNRHAGQIAGYHCWVEFYLPEIGWIPIDASEAFKHPEKKDFFYGTHPADRIHLTTGRDLELGDGHATRPLNYFVYPHIEVGGAAWAGRVDKTFRYSAVPEES